MQRLVGESSGVSFYGGNGGAGGGGGVHGGGGGPGMGPSTGGMQFVIRNSPQDNAYPNAGPTGPSQTVAASSQSSASGTPNNPAVHPESETYCSELLRQGRGFPLFIPEPQSNPPEWRKKGGIAIGDVGRITPEGSFDFFFNIYLPATDLINANGVPEGFEPLTGYNTIQVNPLDCRPGNHVCSRTVTRTEVDGKFQEFPGGRFDFNCQQPTGAVLTLPHGAQLVKLENLARMERYAAEHAESWYKYANVTRGRRLANGHLYLITGWEKAKSWGIAYFRDVSVQSEFKLSFGPTADAVNRYRYRWNGSHCHYKQADSPLDDGTPLNQTTFIHAFTVSVGERIWEKLFGDGLGICKPLNWSIFQKNSGRSLVSYRSPGSSFPWSIFAGGSALNNEDRSSAPQGSSFPWPFLTEGSAYNGGRQATTSAPGDGIITDALPILQIIHPSQIIHQRILREAPQAGVVVTHDDAWRDVFKEDGTRMSGQTASELQQAIFDRFQIIEEDGAVFLRAKPTPTTSRNAATATTEQRPIYGLLQTVIQHPSSDDQVPTSQPGKKRRRQQRSCDICRQRKTRCVGSMANGSCTNCIAFGLACTYLQPSKKRGPKYTENPATMEDLKRQITRLEARLRSLSICSLCSGSLQSQRQESDSCQSRSTSPIQKDAPKEPPDEEELTNDELASRFSQFSLTPFNANYFGAGSGFALVNNTSMMKEEFLGPSSIAPSRRPYFWQVLPWENEAFYPQPGYVYPPDDLIISLVDLYFINVHPTIPILHRPSFERSVAQGLHRTDMSFGGMLLSMLAVASRYSTDPRVFLHGAPLSAGWKFASQLWGVRKFFQSTIYEVQMYAFLTFFVLGTSVPHIAWLHVGLGIRCVQQRGEHRRKPEGHKWSLEDELWKRSFWFLVSMERIICVFLGRPLGIHIDEYDVEFPLAVDDEYLDQRLAQPPGIPSQLSYFVYYSQLIDILGDALQRLYGPKKAKMAMGWDGPEWEQRAVAELDSAMNRLLDSIPPHLRWDPENLTQDIVFFDQSAQLHITYNYILIAIHRRYIQSPSAPSLSICATAARTILHTADIWLSTLQRLPVPNVTNPVFVSGVILVLHILATKRAGFSVDKNQDLHRVAIALEILKFAESRLQPIGRLWELLRELSALDGPLPLDNLPKSDSHSNARSADVHVSAVSNGQYYYPQLEQPLDYSMLAGNQPSELLVSDVAEPHSSTADGGLDDELMSMWMAAPTDIVNPQHWNAFMQYRNANGAEVNWFHGFGQQDA